MKNNSLPQGTITISGITLTPAAIDTITDLQEFNNDGINFIVEAITDLTFFIIQCKADEYIHDNNEADTYLKNLNFLRNQFLKLKTA